MAAPVPTTAPPAIPRASTPAVAPTATVTRLTRRGPSKGLPELGRELVELSVAYAKQETIDPLRSLGRQVAWGVAGAAVASLGLVFVLVGVLRLVQVEAGRWVGGAWSFLPYLAALLVAGAVAALAVKRVGGDDGGAR